MIMSLSAHCSRISLSFFSKSMPFVFGDLTLKTSMPKDSMSVFKFGLLSIIYIQLKGSSCFQNIKLKRNVKANKSKVKI